MDRKIGVLDSGIGGTTTLREIRKLLPNEKYLYLGDSKNCPYGEKSDEELLSLSRENIKRLLKENIKLIVVACNTLTTRVLKTLRSDFPEIDFIGTEPAIKPALDSPSKNLLVLSTPVTADYLEKIKLPALNLIFIEKISPSFSLYKTPKNQNLYNLACLNLASAIESKNNSLIKRTLDEVFSPIKPEIREKVELIVLGCTHYPIILEKIKPFFPNAEFIDGNAGVARRVKEILKQNSLLNEKLSEGTVEYIFT